jgi:5-methylcytosine-specific restriction endonuclease McrA
MSTEVFREKRNAINRKWKQKNRAVLAAKSLAYYHENKEACDARMRAQYHANPEPYVQRANDRRARVRDAEGSYTKADVARIFLLQKGRCAACRISIKVKKHVDHIIPLSRGGSNFPANIQLLCPPCNHSKGAKHPIAWAKENGRLL